MKNVILLAAVGCAGITAAAAEYEPMFQEGRQWSWMTLNGLNSDSGGNLCTRVIDITVGSDTIIDGIAMKRLNLNSSNNHDVTFWGYDKDRKVYLRNESRQEYLLFDFNAKPGDKVNGYLTVTGEDEIEVNYKKYRRLILNDGETYWVEGIGCPDGCISVIESPYGGPTDASIPHLAMSCHEFEPFSNRDFYIGASTGSVKTYDSDNSDYKTMLVADKSWVKATYMPDSFASTFTETVTSYRVTADKKTFDGKECTVIASNRVYPSKHYWEYYLYEEADKIWQAEPSYSGDKINWYLLYDFSLHKGDRFIMKDELGYDSDRITVTDEDYVTSDDGVPHRRLIFDNGMTWIEGFGMGGDARPVSVVPDCFCFGATILGYYHRARLWDYQCHTEGLPLAGINEISEPLQSHNDKRYDLLGRELNAEPAPGAIFISDGKVVKKFRK